MIKISEAVEADSAQARAEAKQIVDEYGEDFFAIEGELAAVAGLAIDPRLEVAIAKMSELERLLAELPGLDCGACGSPTCRAHAEDVVCGYASEVDCVFKLREAMEEVAEELLKLAKTDLPSLQRRNDR
jgi:Na+-translocating ferredoxin:NAD+ oxidoreductase RNF subunit RnfB